MEDRTAGRRTRPAVAVVLAAIVLAVGWHERAALLPHAALRPPARLSGPDGVARITIDTVAPAVPVRLLWLTGRPATPGRDDVLVEDGAGGVLAVTGSLKSSFASLNPGGDPVAAVAAAADGSTWLVDGRGRLLQYSPRGMLLRTLVPTLPVSSVTVDPATNSVWLVRSSSRFTYRLPGEVSPLFERLVVGDSVLRPVGRAQVPKHSILVDLQNAGHLLARGDTVWFAPFIRDEVIAMTATGDTLWRTVRHLPHTTVEPRFELVGGNAVVDYHAVNLGLVFEPNGRLLVLSTPTGMPDGGRLDELDPATGRVLATAALANALPTLAADVTGRIYSIDPLHLLIPGGGPATPLPAIDLPMADGSRLHGSGLRGAPTVLNFWASWCGPCRRELPALDSLRRELASSGARVIGMNDDRDTVAARQFLAKVAPGFPTAFGLGRLQEQFGYLGLPWTLLVSGDGRVVERWVGELTEQNMREIRVVVAGQLRNTPVSMTHHGNH